MNKNQVSILRYTKGFTLIELLVVIAIIGILASVVLASLNSARAKGGNAAIKSNLNNTRAQAELVYDGVNGSYLGVCTDPNIVKGITAAASASGSSISVVATLATGQTTTTANCHSSATGYALSVPLKVAEGTSLYWCVDYTGTSIGRVNPLAATSITCPTS